MNLPSLASIESLAHGMGVMAILLWVYTQVEKYAGHRPVLRQLLLGALFGAASIFALVDPVELQPGLIIDARSVFIGAAAPYCGPIGLIVATIMAAAFRASIGGVGTVPSLVGFGVVGIASLLFVAVNRRRPAAIRTRDLLLLGLVSTSWVVGALALPAESAALFVRVALLPTVVLTVLGTLLLGTLLSREARRVEAEQALQRSALTDPLTGLPNRRAFDFELERASAAVRRNGGMIGVMMLDIDHFKRVNDVLGHAAGDEVIATVGRMLQSAVRKEDLAARVGGEEFAILTLLGSEAVALDLAERIRVSIAENPLRIGDVTVPLTASIGVAVADGAMEGIELVKLADRALYRAKELGRDRVCGAGGAVPRSKNLQSPPRSWNFAASD